MKRAEFIRLLSAAAFLPTGSHAQERTSREELDTRFRDGMKKLDEVFWVPELANWLDRPGKDLRGHFEGKINPPWWSCANAVEAMVDYMELTRTRLYDVRLREIYAGNVLRGTRLYKVAETLEKQGPWNGEDRWKLSQKLKAIDPKKVNGSEFRNEYLDDSAWWGIAWLRFFEWTHDVLYLRTARAIHAHMAANWRKEGGVSWGEEADKRDPNAITNSLFVVLSARLYRVTKEKPFLDWAEKTLAWEKEVKLYDGTGIVDRPGHQGDYWTYNQGAYLGALEALYSVTGKAGHLEEAAAIAETVIAKSGVVREDGVLYEKLSTDGWDVGMFKGICTRYFAILARTMRRGNLHAETAGRIERVLEASAAAILRSKTKDGLYPLEWQEAPRAEIHNFNTQLSALIAVVAALPLRG